LRLEWEAQSLGSNQTVRFVEIIDGSTGMLQEGEGSGKQMRMHPGRLVTRLREEQRNPATLILAAMNQRSLRHRGDAEIDGKRHAVLSFTEGGDEFRIYIDQQTRLPAQTEILEDDPLEGDSSYMLRYSDWRKVDGVMLPFKLTFLTESEVSEEFEISKYQVNPQFKADKFEKH